jgi:hypothetical protein
MTTPDTDSLVESIARGAYPEWPVFSERQRDRCRQTIRRGLVEAQRKGWRFRHLPLPRIVA